MATPTLTIPTTWREMLSVFTLVGEDQALSADTIRAFAFQGANSMYPADWSHDPLPTERVVAQILRSMATRGMVRQRHSAVAPAPLFQITKFGLATQKAR